jgi:NADPH:quinone reductase-like Zn-dependent oxidoreductase
MQAIVQDRYGSTDVLEARELGTPTVGDDQVLVRVRAASLHLGDVLLMRGEPYLLRLASGLRRPKHRVPGSDIAGIVSAVGMNVTTIAVGDSVFGWCDGAFAEYALTGADHLVPKPDNLTFEQAAALGVSATTALQLLRDDGKVGAGQRVLINGASGGVGTFAVQIAKSFGAEVTGVCGPANVELVRAIGADHVIDYTTEDFTRGDARYDFILDNVGNHPRSRVRRALAADGTLLPNGGGHSGGRWLGGLGSVIGSFVASLFIRQQGRPSVKFENLADLTELRELAERGAILPVVGATYPLLAVRDAVGDLAAGHARGTLVLAMP